MHLVGSLSMKKIPVIMAIDVEPDERLIDPLLKRTGVVLKPPMNSSASLDLVSRLQRDHPRISHGSFGWTHR